MSKFNPRDNRNINLKLMGTRLGVSTDMPCHYREGKTNIHIRDLIENEDLPGGWRLPGQSNINNIDALKTRLESNGGILQQERVIYDKRRSLDRAIHYSYQGAVIRKIDDKKSFYKALINPDKNKMDYDDKTVSVGYEYNLNTGDVFEWVGTNTYWLVYLQDLEELAYFYGEIRKCSYEIQWQDEEGIHSSYAAVRGPVETKINFIQKHNTSVDTPNHSLHILMPKNEETLKYFQRYSRFYLKGEDAGSPVVCWRVEATDWISTPGILEITAVEYFINKDEDSLLEDRKIAGELVAKPIKSNKESIVIFGDNFIKPKITYDYEYKGPNLPVDTKWKLDKKYPVEIIVDSKDRRKIKLKWLGNYSGQMELSYGKYVKTIVVESLF